MTAPPQTAHRAQHIEVPMELLDIHKKIQLYIDLCYINKMIFFITRSDSVNYITMAHLQKNPKRILLKY